MITVLINWVLITITTYPIGFVALKTFIKLMKVNEEDFLKAMPSVNVIRSFLGLAIVTAFAEVWSLFAGVGVLTLYAVVIAGLVAAYFCKDEIGHAFDIGKNARTGVSIGLILLMAYGTSRGYMHFDTNLYHAQAIRWIEEYGVVPGLANLQSRFGYNSAEFVLNALYSLKWYLGQSLHCTAGYFALLSSFVAADVSHIWHLGKNDGDNDTGVMNILKSLQIRVSDYVRLGLIFYLGTIYAEMISPASDYYAQLLIFDIVILWLDARTVMVSGRENKNEYVLPSVQGILCVILVYAITIKLSLGLLVLLALVPGIYWIKQSDIRKIITCLISGLVIAIPQFVRNYIISGWILYPSTLLKIGSPDWQLPKGEAQYDAREIGMWGRGITRAEDWDLVTATNWIGDWFIKLNEIEKLLVLGSLLAIICVVVLAVGTVIRKIQKNNDIIVMLILAVSTLFWFISAPLVRYGYAYLLIMPLMTLGYVISTYVVKRLPKSNVIVFVLMAFVVFGLKGHRLMQDIVRTWDYPYAINQQDYIDGNAHTYEIDGVTIYVADDAGQIGYYKFPATPNENSTITLRGTGLEEGFRKK